MRIKVIEMAFWCIKPEVIVAGVVFYSTLYF